MSMVETRARTRTWRRPTVFRSGLLVILAVLVLAPLAMVGYGAFRTRSPVHGDTDWTVDPMVSVLTDPNMLGYLRNSLALAVCVTLASQVLGVALAYLINRTNVPAKSFFRIMIIFPLIVSPLTLALAWQILGAPNVGMVNAVMAHFGFQPFELNVFSFIGIAFVMTSFFVPFVFMSVSGLLSTMDGAVEEAARSLGAGRWTTLRRITLPLITPGIANSGLLVFVLAVGMFSIPSVLGRPVGFQTVIYQVYYAIRRSPAQWNVASAVGLLILAVAMVALLVQRRIIGDPTRFSVFSGRGYRAATLPLGRTRALVTLSLLGYVTVTVILPLTALVIASFMRFTTSNLARVAFTTEHYEALTTGVARTAVTNTVILSVVAPTVLCVLAVLIAYAHRHGRPAVQNALKGISTLPIAIPGTIFGLGLLWLYFQIPLPIYGTLTIMLLAYLASFLPHSVNITLPAMGQVGPVLEESARALGAKSRTILRRIMAPLMAPSLLNVWLIVFVLSARELNASVMIYRPQSRVLEVLIWDFIESGRSNASYAFSVIQTLVIGSIAFVVFRRQGSFLGGNT